MDIVGTTRLRLPAIILAGALLLSGCALGPSRDSSETDSYLVHVVLVWLKEPGNAQHRARIIAASETLREIPGVQDLRVGVVVAGTREVVEDSYDVGLSLRFADQAALQSYLVHPLHVSTVRQDFAPIMERYQVMDFAR